MLVTLPAWLGWLLVFVDSSPRYSVHPLGLYAWPRIYLGTEKPVSKVGIEKLQGGIYSEFEVWGGGGNKAFAFSWILFSILKLVHRQYFF